jgi:hypothetical protein
MGDSTHKKGRFYFISNKKRTAPFLLQFVLTLLLRNDVFHQEELENLGLGHESELFPVR